MKTFFKSSAVIAAFALLTTGAFAQSKADEKGGDATKKDQISFTAMDKDCGVGIMIHKAQAGNSAVTITDASGNVVMRDYLSKDAPFVGKGYDFEGMDEGDYTIEVNSNNEVVTQTVHVYSDENDEKLFVYAE